jgi:putative transcriptional regulator
LKTNKARAIRFSTLDAVCRELACQPGDVLEWIPGEYEEPFDAELEKADR